VIAVVIALRMATGSVSNAQLAAPGASGVVMGHLHLATKDIEASRRFWAALGGVPVQNGALQLIQIQGTFVMLRQSAQAPPVSEGSTVERVVLRVRTSDLPEISQKLEQATGSKVTSAVMTSPEGVTIELRGATSQDTPARLERLVFRTTVPAETRDWYVKTFGAGAGSQPQADPSGARGQVLVATLPGVDMYFNKADAAPAGTRGRALDHVGFEVKNLEEFCKKLEAAGQKLDRPFTRLPNSTTAIAFLTDPWGTYIELTENLAPQK
jgi:catechol 2,3-dioxygenase-like lactoylglutathione lyase family enzyme